MKPGIEYAKKGMSRSDAKDFEKAVEQFREFLYDKNGTFNPKVSAEKNGIDTIYKPCSEIKNILKDMMISKWRNGNNTKQGIYPYLINKNKSLKSR